MSQKKVLNIIQRYHPARGGAELFMKIVSEYQENKLGYDVDVWTTDAFGIDTLWDLDDDLIDKKKEKINGVNVRRFSVGKWVLKNKYLNKIFRVLFGRFPNFHLSNMATCPTTFGMLDVVNSDNLADYSCVTVSSTPYFFLFYVGYLISKKMNIPYVIAPAIHTGVESDDLIRKKYFRRLSIPFYQHASKIILNTEVEGKAISNFCKQSGVEIDQNKFVVIGQGVFLEKIKSGDGKRFRKKYGLKYPIVFQMGSRNYDKGSYNLIDAMKICWDKGIKSHLVFAGVHTEDFSDYLGRLDQKYRKWIINIDNISESEKWDMFDAGVIFSMVSKTDSFGIVYLEAWAYRNPVLACNNEAIKQVVNNGEDGYLLDFDDVEGISKKIEYLLKNENIRKKMGRMGRKKVEEKYCWEKNVKKIRDVYKNL